MMQCDKSDALGPLDEDDSDVEDEENDDDENEEYADEETEDEEETDGEYVASDDDGDDDAYESSHNFSSFNDTFQSSRNFSSFSETNNVPALNNLSLNNLNDSVAFVSEDARPNTVETFCNTTVPTLAMFNALEENDKVLAFKTFLHVTSMPFPRIKHSL